MLNIVRTAAVLATVSRFQLTNLAGDAKVEIPWVQPRKVVVVKKKKKRKARGHKRRGHTPRFEGAAKMIMDYRNAQAAGKERAAQVAAQGGGIGLAQMMIMMQAFKPDKHESKEASPERISPSTRTPPASTGSTNSTSTKTSSSSSTNKSSNQSSSNQSQVRLSTSPMRTPTSRPAVSVVSPRIPRTVVVTPDTPLATPRPVQAVVPGTLKHRLQATTEGGFRCTVPCTPLNITGDPDPTTNLSKSSLAESVISDCSMNLIPMRIGRKQLDDLYPVLASARSANIDWIPIPGYDAEIDIMKYTTLSMPQGFPIPSSNKDIYLLGDRHIKVEPNTGRVLAIEALTAEEKQVKRVRPNIEFTAGMYKDFAQFPPNLLRSAVRPAVYYRGTRMTFYRPMEESRLDCIPQVLGRMIPIPVDAALGATKNEWAAFFACGDDRLCIEILSPNEPIKLRNRLVEFGACTDEELMWNEVHEDEPNDNCDVWLPGAAMINSREYDASISIGNAGKEETIATGFAQWAIDKDNKLIYDVAVGKEAAGSVANVMRDVWTSAPRPTAARLEHFFPLTKTVYDYVINYYKTLKDDYAEELDFQATQAKNERRRIAPPLMEPNVSIIVEEDEPKPPLKSALKKPGAPKTRCAPAIQFRTDSQGNIVQDVLHFDDAVSQNVTKVWI